MRNTVVGIVLALGLLAALFAAAALNPHVPVAVISEQAAEQAAAQIEPGFVGVKAVGVWQVICSASDTSARPQKPADTQSTTAGAQQPNPAPVPLSLSPGGSATPSAPQSADTTPTGQAASGTPAGSAAASPAATPTPAAAISLGRCRAVLLYRNRKDPKQVLVAINFRLIGKARALAMIVRMPSIAKKGDSVVLRIGKGGLKLPVRDCGKDGCLAGGMLAPDGQTGLLAAKQGELVFPSGPDGKQVKLPVPLADLGEVIKALRRAE